MKKLTSKIYRAVAVMMVFFMASCGTDFLDINTDPNNPAEASLSLLLPSAQVAAGFWTARDVQEHASVFVQHYYSLAMSTYQVPGSVFSNNFSGLFADALKDTQSVIDQGTAEEVYGYVGMAKVMKAYLYMVTVDLWGDVPYTEGLRGETILFPAYDEDVSIYNNLISLVDEAKVDLQTAIDNGESPATSDLVYGGDYELWIKAANTIKLRMLLNTRLVDEARARTGIEALIAEDNLISDNSEDFEFNFGPNLAPLNHHPIYQQDYLPGGKTFYQSNYFMYHLIAKDDPRLPFYIFRQGSDADLDFQTTPCSQRTDCVYGWLGGQTPSNGLAALGAAADGYIGRDHGDPSGIPGDNAVRATFGVYPIGGSYDQGVGGGERRFDRSHGTGAGVIPWMTNYMRAFMLAEAALTLGTPGDAKALLIEGVEASFEKVEDFGLANDPTNAEAMDADAVVDYIGAIEDDFDGFASANLRLNLVITEKYFASFGNGIEAYTDFRRTGMPSNLPPSLAPTGPYPVRLPYPPSELSANPNAPSPVPLVSEPIFWDVN